MAGPITLIRKPFKDTRLKEYVQMSECNNPRASIFCCVGLGILETIVRGKLCSQLSSSLAAGFRGAFSKYYDYYERCKLDNEYQTILNLINLLDSKEHSWWQLMEWLNAYMLEDRDSAASSLFQIMQGLVYNIVSDSSIKDEIFSEIPLKKRTIETIVNSISNVLPIYIRIYNKENNLFVSSPFPVRELPIINLLEDKMSYFLLYHEEVLKIDNIKINQANLFRQPFTYVPFSSVSLPRPPKPSEKDDLHKPFPGLVSIPESNNDPQIHGTSNKSSINNFDERPFVSPNTKYNPPKQIIAQDVKFNLAQSGAPAFNMPNVESQEKVLGESALGRKIGVPLDNLAFEETKANARPQANHELADNKESNYFPSKILNTPQTISKPKLSNNELPEASEIYQAKSLNSFLPSQNNEKSKLGPFSGIANPSTAQLIYPSSQHEVPANASIQVPVPTQFNQGLVLPPPVQGPFPSRPFQGPIPPPSVQGPILPPLVQGPIPTPPVQGPNPPLPNQMPFPPLSVQAPILPSPVQGHKLPEPLTQFFPQNEKPVPQSQPYIPLVPESAKSKQQPSPLVLAPQNPGLSSNAAPLNGTFPHKSISGLSNNDSIVPSSEHNLRQDHSASNNSIKLAFPPVTPVNTNRVSSQLIPDSKNSEEESKNLVPPFKLTDSRGSNHQSFGSVKISPQSSSSSVLPMNLIDEKRDRKISTSLKSSKNLIEIIQVFATTIKSYNKPITDEVLNVVRNSVETDNDLLNIPEIKEFYEMDLLKNKKKTCIKCEMMKEPEEFNIIQCQNECAVCSRCRISYGFKRCPLCSRFYSEYENEIFDVTKESF